MKDAAPPTGLASERLGHLLHAPPGFIELLPVAAYACDREGRVLWFNRRAEQLWGRSPRIGDLTDRFCGSFRLFVRGREIERTETPMAQVLATGEPVSGEEAVLERPDGSRAWAMVHIMPVKDEHGEVLGAVNCFHDTTELQAVRARAADSEAHFRQLLHALPAAVYTTDAEGRITYFNNAAVEMSGRTPKLGKDKWCVTWKLYKPDGTEMQLDECPMAITIREQRPVRGVEAVAERPDGTRTPFIPFPTPLHDSEGKLIGAVNMLVDISERKQAETNQITLLKELNHRVKNNMQMLHALLFAAQRETVSTEARNVLADATRRISAMAAAQKVLYEEDRPASFSVEDFLQSVCAMAQTAFEREFDLVIEEASGTLSNDVAMPLALIASELLTNAVKHAINGSGGTIRIGLSARDGEYLLWVQDCGPGFDYTPANRKRSSGLGLVEGLARQLGGTFAVERGEGARCVVSFSQKASTS